MVHVISQREIKQNKKHPRRAMNDALIKLKVREVVARCHDKHGRRSLLQGAKKNV